MPVPTGKINAVLLLYVLVTPPSDWFPEVRIIFVPENTEVVPVKAS